MSAAGLSLARLCSVGSLGLVESTSGDGSQNQYPWLVQSQERLPLRPIRMSRREQQTAAKRGSCVVGWNF